MTEETQQRYKNRVDTLSEMCFVFVKKDKVFKCRHVFVYDSSVKNSDDKHWEQFIALAKTELAAPTKEEI